MVIASVMSVVNTLQYQDVNSLYEQNNQPLQVFNLDAINTQIINILTTPLGERPFEPTFGSILPTLLYEPITDSTGWSIETEIFDALEKWQPRIKINHNQTRAIPVPASASYVLIIAYTTLYNQVSTVLTFSVSQ